MDHYIAEIGMCSKPTRVIQKQTLAWGAQKGGKKCEQSYEVCQASKKEKSGKNGKNFIRKWKSRDNVGSRKRNEHVHTETDGSTVVYAQTFNFTALHNNPPHDGDRKVATLHRRSA